MNDDPVPARRRVRGRVRLLITGPCPVTLTVFAGVLPGTASAASTTGVQSGLSLDVSGASTANSVPVQLRNCGGAGNQQWSLG